MSIESNKILGGVGALLMFISFLGMFGSGYTLLLLVVGAILVLIALKGFADHYQHGGIFNNALYGFITVIVGLVATVAIFIMLVLQVLANIGVIGIDWSNPIEVQQYFMSNMDVLWQMAGTAIGAFTVFYISAIVSAVLFRKALDALSARSGEKMFGTAGLIWLIGAIIPLVGLLLIWISWILMAVGFFSIKTAQAPTQPAITQPPPPQPPTS